MSHNIYKLFKMDLHDKFIFFLGLILSLFSSGLTLLIPKFIGSSITSSFIKNIYSHIEFLFLALLLFVGTYFLHFISAILLGNLGLHILKNNQILYIKKIINLPMDYYHKISSGEFSSRLTNDLMVVTELLSTMIPQLISALIIIVGCLIMLFVISIKLSLFLIFSIGMLFLFVFPMNLLLEKYYVVQQNNLSNISSDTVKKIENIVDVKTYLGEKYEINKSHTLFSKMSKNFRKIIFLTNLNSTLSSIFIVAFIVIILLRSQYMINNNLITISQLVTFILYSFQMMGPILNLISSFSDIAIVKGSLKRIVSISNIPDEKNLLPLSKISNLELSDIVFENVSFKYKEKYVLKNISFDTKDKNLISFVGYSGSGKSTIMFLILKFYTSYEGKITIGGQDIKKIDTNVIRNSISYVSQKNVFQTGTIKSNLLYGKNDTASLSDIKDALKLTDSDKIITKKEKGLLEKTSEMNAGLSQGERQRLNLVKSLLSNPKILILDEPTSNIDNVSEKIISNSIKNISRKTKTIVITHKLQTIKAADIIFVVEKDGTIKFSGTHEELLEKSETYNRMYQKELIRID